MDRLQEIRAFVAVVDGGGFTRAAGRLGLTRAAISKHVIQLEERLGARLLQRTTRQVSVTETGRAFYERCVRILSDVEEAEQAASRLHAEPMGELRVVAPTNFGLPDLGTAIADLLAKYPRLRLDLTLNDRFVDPIESGFDIAVRIGDLPRSAEASLMARKLNTSRRILCAAGDYLRMHGEPTVPDDLAHHACLSYSYVDSPLAWKLIGREQTHVVKVSGRVVTSHGQVLRSAAVRGLGIAYGPLSFFAEEIAAGRLRLVLPEYKLPEVTIYSVYPAARHLSAKVRAFNDFMVQHFASRAAAADRASAGATLFGT